MLNTDTHHQHNNRPVGVNNHNNVGAENHGHHRDDVITDFVTSPSQHPFHAEFGDENDEDQTLFTFGGHHALSPPQLQSQSSSDAHGKCHRV